jgi:RNA polymerase sigma-70 factor (sigma-E family)
VEVAVGLAARDVRAFAPFVRAYTPTLLRTAYLLTGNRSAAEDLVQETLVHLYPKWDKVAAADAPLAYVRRSMSNNFVNGTRRASSRELVLETVPDARDQRDEMSQVVDREALWGLLRTLPDRQRAALVLRFFHDLPDEEIAVALGCRLGTVRSLISRGLATLRDGVDDDAGAQRWERRAQ